MRTPLLRLFRKMVMEHRAADALGVPPHAVRELAAARQDLSRRQFLSGATAAAAGSLALPLLAQCGAGSTKKTPPTTTAPRIAIIGGGLAGLSCALTLKDAGIESTVYETSKVGVGGRAQSSGPGEPGCLSCHSVGSMPKDVWADGQYTDPMGELVDTQHVAVHALAKRFGLEMVDFFAFEPKDSTDTFWFLGGYYTKADADKDFAELYPTLKADLDATEENITYDSMNAKGKELDAMSLEAWIKSRVKGGLDSKLGRFIKVAYEIEYGADAAVLSALEMIVLLGYSDPKKIQIFGESDERFRVKGGISRIPQAMALELGDRIKLGWHLNAIAKMSTGEYTLTFEKKGDIVADIVVMAFPFAAFKGVDYSKAGFDALKTRAIQELGAGHNGKLSLQFTDRMWNEKGGWGISNGNMYSDNGMQLVWDTTRGQDGKSGILCNYTGGSVADAMGLSHAYGTQDDASVKRAAEAFLKQVEMLIPGITAKWNGRAEGTMCHLAPRWGSSYAYWKVGQAQLFGGYERVKQGGVYFAGEHTSVDWQGFFEGAATEGIAAGEEIAALVNPPAAVGLLDFLSAPSRAA